MVNNIVLKYEVTITTEERGTIEQKVKTPFNIDFSDIQQVIIQHSPTINKVLSIYPNGLLVYMENTSNRATIKTNWPIDKDVDGNLVIVEPKE